MAIDPNLVDPMYRNRTVPQTPNYTINDAGQLTSGDTVLSTVVPRRAPTAAGPDILSQIRSRLTQPTDVTASPFYTAGMNAADAAARQAAQGAAEFLNSKGVFNSSMTRDATSQAFADARMKALPGILQQVYGFDQQQTQNLFGLLNAYNDQEQTAYQRQYQQQQSQLQQRESQRKYLMDLWRANGIASNEIAIGLGVNPGQMYSEAQQKALDREAQARRDELDRKQRLQIAQMENARITAPPQRTPLQSFEDTIVAKIQGNVPLEQWTDYEKQYAINHNLIGQKPNATQDTRNERAAVYEAIDEALAKGASIETIRANINAQRGDLIRKGVNPDELLRYLEELGFQQMTNESTK
jgi:hypothetical protein